MVQGRPNTPPAEPRVIERTLSGSFSDIFSGTAWIDEKNTTLYRDNASGAFLFHPNIIWSQADDARVVAEMEKEKPWERMCLGERCLKVRGLDLFLERDGKEAEILYPGSDSRNRISVVAAPLSSEWLLGITRREGENYYTKIFRYDGENFKNVFSDGRNAFVSTQTGFLGLGGSDNEWLALWSGYEGHALRSRFGGEPTDISSFFGIRLMRDGFLPYIVRIAGRESVDWYLWGVGEGNPRLIKLFELLDGEIGGVVDYTPLIFDESVFKIIPRFVGTTNNTPSFLVQIDKREGGSEWKDFKDIGFRSDVPAWAVSKNIKTTDGITRAASVSPLRLFSGLGTVQFEVSTDGNLWIPTIVGRESEFNTSGSELYWRTRFESGGNTRITPFFEGIHVDYRESL